MEYTRLINEVTNEIKDRLPMFTDEYIRNIVEHCIDRWIEHNGDDLITYSDLLDDAIDDLDYYIKYSIPDQLYS